jgi:RimJ/RimL family protein N-acetyltransferase
MEKMPYQPEMDVNMVPQTITTEVVSTDWRTGLPLLTGRQVVLRELRVSDATSLFAMLTSEEVSRFISPPPTTVDGFEQFIAWTLRMRSLGNYACFAVTVKGSDVAIGIFQLRELEAGFRTAEWGFAIGSAYWGTGAFMEAAELMIRFAFETVGVHRLEARASVRNGRGNGALRKVGAVQEGVLRRSFLRHGEYHDQVLWSILDEDWFGVSAERRPTSIH